MRVFKLHEGIVNNKIFEEFEEQKGISLFNHSANSCRVWRVRSSLDGKNVFDS